MEHGAFDLAGLAEYMAGLVEGGPTNSGHRTPAVIVEVPVNGINEDHILYNAWQFRQILARGVHGILLAQAETAGAVRAFVESCRYPWALLGTDASFASPLERMAGATRGVAGSKDGRPLLGLGSRGRGSEDSCAPIWGVSVEEYQERCDPWPLNPNGELLLGIKIESPEGVANVDEILAVPGLGFAEMGYGDLSLSLRYKTIQRSPYPKEMQAARDKIFGLCRKYGIAFVEPARTPEMTCAKIDEGVRVISGHSEENAKAGRAYSKRTMPV